MKPPRCFTRSCGRCWICVRLEVAWGAGTDDISRARRKREEKLILSERDEVKRLLAELAPGADGDREVE